MNKEIGLVYTAVFVSIMAGLMVLHLKPSGKPDFIMAPGHAAKWATSSLMAATNEVPLSEHEKVFVDSWNDWMKTTTALSPASPDYLERVREYWLKYEVGEKFRRFERELNDN